MVDTSNEIAGGGSVPHPCIGRSRRIPVWNRKYQHDTLLVVVQNHTPEVPSRLFVRLCNVQLMQLDVLLLLVIRRY